MIAGRGHEEGVALTGFQQHRPETEADLANGQIGLKNR